MQEHQGGHRFWRNKSSVRATSLCSAKHLKLLLVWALISFLCPATAAKDAPKSLSQAEQQQAANHILYINSTPASSPSPSSLGAFSGTRPSQKRTNGQAIAAGASNQLDDWPFFKSLLTTRSSHQNGSQKLAPTGGRARAKAPPTKDKPPIAAVIRSSTLVPAPATASSTTTTTTTSSTTTTEQPALKLAAKTPTEAEPEAAVSRSTQPVGRGGTTDAQRLSGPLSNSSSSLGAEEAEEEEEEEVEDELNVGSLRPLFPVNLHRSIQEAVNRIVNGTINGSSTAATGASAAGAPEAAGARAREWQPPAKQSQTNESSSHEPGKGFLSLNVLFKNFGIQNLTSLDQIMLKSSHISKQDRSARREHAPPPAQDKLSRMPPVPHQILEFRGSKEESGADELQPAGTPTDASSAECRIEYTVKHVNVSLLNSAQGDYNCDYSIDRKMAAKGQQPERVCSLEIASHYFRNESHTDKSCDSSYLSVGSLSFCYRFSDSAASLNRSFSFPLDRNSFDVKVVHKQESRSSDSGAQIHLEIRPLLGSCKAPAKPNDTSGAGNATTLTVGGATSRAPPSLVPPAPGPSTTRATPLSAARSTAAPKASSTTTATPPRAASAARAEVWPATGAPERRPALPLRIPVPAKWSLTDPFKVTESSEGPLCDGQAHADRLGQIWSPQYPHLYSANISCYFEFRQATPAHCSLLVQFRDFDLISADQAGPAERQQCREDYLQIGETRYCNRYAMIGHKMELPFQRAEWAREPRLRILFRSNHLQAGRGFLARYQQKLCPETASASTPAPSSTGVPLLPAPAATERQADAGGTLAPPLQTPDFGLASRTSTTSKPLRARAGQPGAPPTASNQMEASTSSLIVSLQSLPAGERSAGSLGLVQCGSLESARTFLIRSPAYPANYGPNLECNYYVRKNSSQVCYLELTYLEFDLEPDADCRFDYLEVNGVRLCGSLRELEHKITRIYLFQEQTKLIKFRSDPVNSRAGFLIRAEQLECSPWSDGNIVRAGADANSTMTSTTSRRLAPSTALQPAEDPFAGFNLTEKWSRQIQYDVAGLPAAAAAHNYSRPSGRSPADSAGCDATLFGREVTIRSPSWPESYSSAELPATCRYRLIVDPPSGPSGNPVCQLELRFVHLHLGASDCIDVDGHELLCGFHTKNLVNYYPISRSQSQLTVSFLSALGGARSAKAEVAPLSRGSPADEFALDEPTPAKPQVHRFLIIAKQHECVDGFLAPEVIPDARKLAPPAPQLQLADRRDPNDRHGAESLRQRLRPSLMYSFNATSGRSDRGQAERDGPRRPAANDTCVGVLELSAARELKTVGFPRGFSPAHCLLRISRGSRAHCSLDVEFLELDLGEPGATIGGGHLECSPLGNYLELPGERARRRLCSLSQLGGRSRVVNIPFAANQMVVELEFHAPRPSNARRGLLARLTGQSHHCPHLEGPQQVEVPVQAPAPRCARHWLQPNGFISSAGLRGRQACHLRLQLLPGFCHFQLSFNLFALGPRTGLEQRCSLDYLELEGEQYCSRELLNRTRVLAPRAAAGERAVELLYWPGAETGSFRATFRQLECQPEVLPLTSSDLERAQALPPGALAPVQQQQPPPPPPPQPALKLIGEDQSAGEQRPDFREVLIKEELFELSATAYLEARANHDETPPGASYKPNQFVVFRLRKVSGAVCGVHLLFYKLDLEPSPGCKHDFLDINGRDRLCGQLDPFRDSTSRNYAWPGGADFLVSFVSDHVEQRSGFLVIGRQLSHCNAADGQLPAANSSGRPLRPAPAPSDDSSLVPSAGHAGAESCHKLLDQVHFQIFSPGWPNRYAAGAHCHYLIERAGPGYCSVRLRLVSLVLGARELSSDPRLCSARDEDQLVLDGRPVCGQTSSPKTLVLDFRARSFLELAFRAPAGAGLGFHLEAVQDKCPASGALEAPAQASQGARNTSAGGHCGGLLAEEHQDLLAGAADDGDESGVRLSQECVFVVRRLNDSNCAIDLTVERFQLAPHSLLTGRCELEYLELDGSRLCGGYPAGHRMRFAFEPGQLDKVIRVRHASAGFALRLARVRAGQCGEPAGAHPSRDSDIIGYLPSSSGAPTNVSLAAAAAAGSTLCQFTHQRARQFILSPNYSERPAGSLADNNHCLYRILAASYDYCSVRLQILELELADSASSGDQFADDTCTNDYLLIDQRRYCRMPALGHAPVLHLAFPESTPREIQLVYHTGAGQQQQQQQQGEHGKLPVKHSAKPKLFKLFYEQITCAPPPGPQDRTGEEERQARRSHFHQLSYPSNYVSEPRSHDRAPPASNPSAPPEGASHQAAHAGEDPFAGLQVTLRKEIVVARGQ